MCYTFFYKQMDFFGSGLILLRKNHNFRVVFAYVFAKQNKPEIPKKTIIRNIPRLSVLNLDI